jgi:PKD repeat protein
MILSIRTIFLTILIILSLYSDVVIGQCPIQCNEEQCGTVNVSYSSSGGNFFCEGGIITLENESSTLDFEQFEINWGDDSGITTLNNYNNVSHTYNFASLDPCDDGTIDVIICFNGKKFCSSGVSCHWGLFPITVKLKPKADFNAPAQVCLTSPASFSEQACNETSYSWNFGDGGTSSSANPSHSFPGPGNYNVCLTVSNDCGSDAICKNVLVVPPPVAAFAQTPASGIGCNPLTVSFTNQSNFPYVSTTWNITPNDTTWWHFADTTMTHSSTNITVVFTHPETYNVSLTATNICGSDTEESTITVNTSPTVSIAPIANQCQTSFTYYPSAVVTGTGNVSWQFPGGSPSTGSGSTPGSVTYSSAGSYTVTVSVQNECGTVSATQTFVMVDPDSGPVFPPETFCLNAPDFNLDTEVLDGEWSGSGVNSSDVFDPSTAGTGTHTLTYTQQIASCDITSNLQVTVLALPTVNAGTDQTVCAEDSPFTLSGTPAGGTWSGSGISPTGLFDPQQAGAGVFNFTYSYTNTNNCSNTDNIQVTVQEVVVSLAGNETIFCNSTSSVQLSASPSGGTWSGNGVQPNGNFTPSNAGLGAINLVYTFTNSNGCSDTDTLSVTVIEIGTINAGSDIAVCLNDSPFLLEAIEPPGGTWSGNGINGNTFNPQTAGVGNNNLTYTVGTGTCLQSDELIITVIDLPVINIDPPGNICLFDEPINLIATPGGGVWAGQGITDTLAGIFTPGEAGLGTFQLTYSYTNPSTGCSNSQTTDVTIYQVTIDLSSNETLYCNTDNTYSINADVSGAIGGGNGTWSGIGITPDGDFNPSFVDTSIGTDTLIYSFTDGMGCPASDTLLVIVIEAEDVDAGTDVQLCQNEPVFELTGFSPPGGAWSGSPAISANSFNPSLASVGSNIITYSLGTGSCLVTDTREVTILPVPDVSAGNNQSICLNEGDITVAGSPAGGFWSGDGVSSTGVFSPFEAGNFPITYQFTNTQGCTDSASVNIYVEGIPPFSFAVNDTACIGDALIFSISGGSGTNCNWNFGDGTISNNCNLIHTYTVSGTYLITLTVETPLGCTDSLSQTVFVAAPPNALFSHDADNTNFICTPLVVNIQDQSNIYGTNATFIYDFGNGDQLITSNPDTTFQYTYIGNYIVSDTTFYTTLTVVNTCGTSIYTDSVKVAPTPQVEFGPLSNNICSGTPVLFNNITIGNPDNFLFDWGDGTTTISTEPDTIAHTFFAVESDSIYTVCLTAENECGSDLQCWNIVVHPNTVISFFYTSDFIGCEPFTVNFQDISTDNTQLPEWNFGDGDLAIGDSVSHTFQIAGTYMVSNFVTNGCAFDTSTVSITVLPKPIITSLNVEPIGCVNAEIQFSVEADVPLAGISWNFGDGTPPDSTNAPLHLFQEAGTYTVSATIISAGNQCSASQSANIIIVDKPQADFTGNFTGCSPFQFSAINSSLGATYYEWNFGDSNTSAIANPQHTFVAFENTVFTTMMIAYNDVGCSDTAYHNVTVYPQPIAAFSVSENAFCETPASVTFFNLSQNAVGFWWDTDDGTLFTDNNPVYVYEQMGNYEVSLIAENIYGCMDTVTHPILVVPQPLAIATLPSGVACVPDGITPLNQSTNATDYLWTLNDGQTDTAFTPDFNYYSPGEYSLMLIATNQHICPDTALTTFTVYPSPTADFTFFEITEPIPQGLVQFEDQSYDNIIAWLWNFNGLDSSILQNPQYRFLSKANQAITLTVTNNFGCPDDTIQYLKVQLTPGLFFPNAFTPDSGIPEVQLFKPKGVCIKEYKIEIYDKWGGLLWESDLLHEGQPAEGWDGTFRGQPVPQGSYVWKARAVFENGAIWEGKEYGTGKFPTGTVTLIR